MQPPESVWQLARSYRHALAHEQQVMQLAVWLFECLRPLHALGEEEGLLLCCGALLHDIGWADGGSGHHKAALKRILATDLPPLDERQRRIVALVARYHRKALPAKKHAHYMALSPADQRIVCVLGGILRVADGLDRTHTNAVTALTCEITDDAIRLTCTTTGRAEAERRIAQEKSDLLQATFARAVSIRMV